MESSISEECAKMTSIEMMDHLYNLTMSNKDLNFNDGPVIHPKFIKNNILRIQYIMNKLMSTYVNNHCICYRNADGEKVIPHQDVVRLKERIHVNMYHYMYNMIPGCPDYRELSMIDDYYINDPVYVFIIEELSKIDHIEKGE